MLDRLALLAVLFAAPLAAQVPPPATPVATAPVSDLVKVAIETSEGRIVLALDRGRAPITTANFLRYLDAKRLDGIFFYRAMKLWEGTGLVQAGVRDGAKLYRPIAHEPTSKTGLSHEDGTISMARAAAGTAQGDFFITIGRIEGFDAGTKQPGDDLGYAAFGRVVEGMDVVKRLLLAPVSPTAGAKTGMLGQMLVAPVKVVRAVRVKE